MRSSKLPTGLVTSNGDAVQVQHLLGTGTQGAVYAVRVDGERQALKLYHHGMADVEQRRLIERLVKTGAPSHAFLWPRELVTDDDHPGEFGYLMPLRDERFRSLEDFMARRVTCGFKALLTACINLSDAFHRLHVTGYCYRDISFGNVSFDPATGDVGICDNDNVDVNGSAPAGVLGTPRFMAPEIVRGEGTPSTDTDRYSLAVLLFNMLLGGHPLDGALEARIHSLDMPAMIRLYGDRPVYIFHPNDTSNRPVKGIHDNPIIFRPIYPRRILDLFETSFTVGLDHPTRRVLESEWRQAFIEARDLLHPCARCRHHNFLEPEVVRSHKATRCWQCKAEIPTPPHLSMNGITFLLVPGSRVFAHHLGDRNNFDDLVAEVVAHPTDRGRVGLRNMTGKAWTMTRTDGQTVEIAPDRTAGVIDGYRIHFGLATGGLHA